MIDPKDGNDQKRVEETKRFADGALPLGSPLQAFQEPYTSIFLAGSTIGTTIAASVGAAGYSKAGKAFVGMLPWVKNVSWRLALIRCFLRYYQA